jgi:hypothetical protein
LLNSLKISSHSGFQPLKEVWVGNVYPESFAHAVPPEQQDIFCQISEITQQDIKKLVKCLESLNVKTRLPSFGSIDLYLDEHDNLIKPPIMPRDWAMTLGDQLYIRPQYLNQITGFESTIAEYRNAGNKVSIINRSCDPTAWISFPSVVRVGLDLFVDTTPDNLKVIQPVLNHWAETYRVHVSQTGDHSDGVFCPIAPGHIFSTHYRTKYADTFPDWEVFWLKDTTLKRQEHNGYNGNWWIAGMHYAHFNDFVFDTAKKWIGDARETVFEVNMLVIDEKNIICIAEDDAACRKLESLGITPHVVDFKTRGFWDGGIHCLTSDIHRLGDRVDYWPTRGTCGIRYYK